MHLSISVTKQQTIKLRGHIRITSYCIVVTHGKETWSVFQTDDQVSKLSAALLQPTIEGHLYKRTENTFSPKWNKRYFKFIGTTLYYSEDLNPGFDITGSSYRKIDLTDAKVIPTLDVLSHEDNMPPECTNMKGMFEIHKKDSKVVYLKASTKSEMIKWVELIKGERGDEDRIRSMPAVSKRFSLPVQRMPSTLKRSPPSAIHHLPSFRGSLEQLGSPETIKIGHISTMLQNLCKSYPESDILRSFLLVNVRPNEEVPQMRMMLDAVKDNNINLIESLHEQHGVAIDFLYKGRSLFIEACKAGNIAVVKYFIITEPEDNFQQILYRRDQYDSTAFHYACASSLPIACLLASCGSIDKLVLSFGKWTPLHHMAQHQRALATEQTEYLEKLITYMLPYCDSQDLAGHTPLHICSKQSNSVMALLLLQKGANWDIPNMQGKTFLHLLMQNSSAKSAGMVATVLKYLLKSATTKEECTKQLNFLEMRDQEGKTAIQQTFDKRSANSLHGTLLIQHYSDLENYKYSLICTDILTQCSKKSITEIKETKVFQKMVEFYSSVCSVSDYHNDVNQLIRRVLDMRTRTETFLQDLNISEKDKIEFVNEITRGVYPVVHKLFITKKRPVDAVLNRYLSVYNKSVTPKGFGITDQFWDKIKDIATKVVVQRKGMRKSATKTSVEEILFKRSLELLAEIPQSPLSSDKVYCLRAVFDMFECEGADEEFSLLSYLMVRGASLKIPWSAEIDYIMTLSPTENCMMLKAMQMFFLNSWMKMKDGILQVEDVNTLENLINGDLRCLWHSIKKFPTADTDISLLHELFFNCAHNTSGERLVVLSGVFSTTVLSNAYMVQIVERLQFTFTETEDEGLEVTYGDFLDNSFFAKITSSFGEILDDKPVLVGENV